MTPEKKPPLFSHFYEIETFCPKKQRMVNLTLGSSEIQKGVMVHGKPVLCSYEFVCSQGEKCFLNSLLLESRRKNV
jgi:hypothetical protein